MQMEHGAQFLTDPNMLNSCFSLRFMATAPNPWSFKDIQSRTLLENLNALEVDCSAATGPPLDTEDLIAKVHIQGTLSTASYHYPIELTLCTQ